jgi:cell division protein FtsZ
MVPGLINLDFADVKAVMSGMGLALMGSGISQGEGRAREAAMKAITSPLLEDVSIDGAQGVLMNITSGWDLTVEEVHEAASAVYESAREDAQIYFGTVFDDNAGDEMRITVIATGIEGYGEEKRDQARTEDKLGLVPKRGASAAREREPIRKASPEENIEDREIPTYLRKGSGTEESQFSRPEEQPKQGRDEFVFDEDDREIPSFIRRQAD